MNRRALLSLPVVVGAVAAASPVLASGGGGGGAPAKAYTRFPTLTATVMRPDGRRGVMTVEAGIDVHDPNLVERAALQGPRLRAAYSAVVQRAAGDLRPGQVPDVDRLSRALQLETSRILGRGVTLLLGTVMVD